MTILTKLPSFGQHASGWLEENQTWDHAALALMELIEEYS